METEPELLYSFAIMGYSMLMAILFGGLTVRAWKTNPTRAKIFLGITIVSLIVVFIPVVEIMRVAPRP